MNNIIKNFNQQLINNSIDLNIINYVIEVNELTYNIDISFINDFMDLIDKDECCIPQEYLFKYGVLTNIETSGTIKTLIDQCNIKLLRAKPLYNVIQRDDNTHKKEYFLHPLLFKYILIRSKNTNIYTQYYLLLEECIKHYSDYQINKHINTIQENNKLKLLKLTNKQTLDRFVIVYDQNRKSFKHGTIKGSNKNIKETLHDLNLTDDNIVFDINVPSQQNYCKKMKEVLKNKLCRQKVYVNKENKYKFYQGEHDDDDITFMDDEEYTVSTTRWFKLVDIELNDFFEKLTEINKERFINN